MKTVHGACPHDCPDTCAWQVSVDDDGRAVALAGNPEHPFTRGALCAKLKRYLDRVYSERRILHPMQRVGAKGEGRFERISWDAAMDLMVTRLRETLERDGPLGAMPCSFAGTIGLLHRFAGERFFARLGATGLDRQICGNVAYDAVASTVGAGDTVPPEELAHARLILIWGSNTAVTNVHLWGGPIREARRAGARVVVVDPVRTPTAAHADWHLQVRPGTDAALAMGLMHVIVRDGLHDADYLAAHSTGFDQLAARLADYPPARVAALTGIAATDIERLAREWATTRPAALRLMVGMERYSNGFGAVRAVACLPVLTNAWRERGGGLAHFTGDLFAEALDLRVLFPGPDEYPAPARTVHLAQLGRVLTDPAMAPPITWMLVYNLNPVVTMPNQNLVVRGLEREDLFTVVHEQFMTDTARYADLVLPATTQVEHWELMPSWGQTYLALNPPAIAPLGEAIANTELFRRLSAALGFDDADLLSDDESRIRALLGRDGPRLAGIDFARLERDGWAGLALDEGPHPRAAGRFSTASGKAELYSAALAESGLDPLPGYVPVDDGADAPPLRLVSAKVAHFLNSEYVNLPHRGTARHAPEVQLNPADAAARGIADGDTVRMYNDRGAIEAHARVSADTAPGIVSMPFSWWCESTLNGAGANALTPDGLSDRGYGSNAFDARVEVCRVG